MNILIVTAHPSPHGYTHKIAEAYAHNRRLKGHTVEIIDLYAKEYKVDLLTFEDLKSYKLTTLQKKFQKQLSDAHEIAIVHPVWWGMPPAILKNWVDITFWHGVAYKEIGGGKLEKLLDGKAVRIFATCGGPSWVYAFPWFPLKPFWKTSVFEFCGADVVDIQVCGNLDKWKDERRDKIFEKFLKTIKKIK